MPTPGRREQDSLSVFVGMVCGFVNGLVSSFWNVPSFIVTLGMLNIARGAALEVTDARTLFEFPNVFNEFGTATVFGVPAIFVVALAMVLLGWAVLTRTVFGRLIYAVGDRHEAVRLSGHDTLRLKVTAFVISGLTVGIGAIVYMARLTIASPILGTGFELNAIAAVIIGGTSPQWRSRFANRHISWCLPHRSARQRPDPNRSRRFRTPNDYRWRDHPGGHSRFLPRQDRGANTLGARVGI